ncbi:MAG: hypothetical protein GIX03_10640 [Candidatus Eremiobacteraeota bacterium]|nr:hypothetical protein [Candidatus Eremiobacteraeota bacterium]MBC5803428.1 hypothetical protein [Candidatus Eremiobacteraeota bacterium]
MQSLGAQTVGQPLRSGKVVDRGKGVLDHAVRDAAAVKLTGEPEMTAAVEL